MLGHNNLLDNIQILFIFDISTDYVFLVKTVAIRDLGADHSQVLLFLPLVGVPVLFVDSLENGWF